jgi:hypothetical protein
MGFETEVTRVINDITKFGFDLGLKEMEKGNVQGLLQSHDKELDNEDLINLERENVLTMLKSMTMTNKLACHRRNSPSKKRTKCLELPKFLKKKILNGDPDLERSMKVRQEIENSIRYYRDLYEGKRN